MEKENFFQNSYEESYQDFQNSQLSKKLNSKFSPKPFFKKYRKIKRFSDVGAILFSFLSALTAFAFVFLVCSSMNVGFHFALILSGLTLFALEYSKRLILEPVVLDFLKFRKYHVFLVAFFGCLSTISIYSSFQGSKMAVNQLNKEIALIDIDSIKKHHNGKIKGLESKIIDYQNNKQYRNDKGIILYKVSTRLIPELEKERKAQEKTFENSLKNATKLNEISTKNHHASNDKKGLNLAYVTLFCELLLIICLSFGNYYDYRSFVEMSKVDTNRTDSDHQNKLVYTDNPKGKKDSELLLLARKKIDADISTYRHKLKNKVGKPETAKKRIAELTAKKEMLQESI